jgi:ABC-type dipeptide transport system, periplasmic component
MGVLLGCAAVGSGNRAYWCDKEFDDLISKARSATSLEERTELYKKAQLRFKDQAPWVTIAHSVVYQPVRKEVKDFRIDPFGGNILIDLDIDQ